MKDIVANRRKLGLARKLRVARMVLRENGPGWTLLFGTYYVASALADRAHALMHRLRLARHLPGLNSATLNREIWDGWNWERGGEEWTVSDAWKASLIEHVLRAHVPPGGLILEIGPGAGRWTEVLAGLAGHLTAVDISQECVEICRRKFSSCPNTEFHVTDGSSLPLIADSSIDAVWSFDVFVHINARETAGYIDEFRRVLRPGGRAVIHHGATGGCGGGWRSDVTADVFRGLVESRGLTLVAEIDRWRDGGREFEVSCYGDLVTIFEKPAEPERQGQGR